eukprot:TRINITY_DN11283_c0_g1_i1.p1 TRINITY_DN11283_c0_g1~~TRINITY_DN11283_c0_g1_i1.p1  ORF type:complete len:601 (-),score=60.54 TRINITY_DN11283_c0_g1_i1:52-1854(-)
MSKPKKRTRSRYTSQACDFCKHRHLKCDGASPCAQCSKRKRECTFTKRNVKRGPKPANMKREPKPVKKPPKIKTPPKIEHFEQPQIVPQPIQMATPMNQHIPDKLRTPEIYHPIPVKIQNRNNEKIDSVRFLESEISKVRYLLAESDQKYEELYRVQSSMINIRIPSPLKLPIEIPHDSIISALKIFHTRTSLIVPNNFNLTGYPIAEILQKMASQHPITLDSAILLFVFSNVLSHGYQLLGQTNLSDIFSNFAKDLANQLFFSSSEILPEIFSKHADQIISCLYLLILHCVQNSDFLQARTYVSLAYNLLNMHVNEVAPNVSHRLYAHLAGMSRSTSDMSHWVDNAHLLGMEGCTPFNRTILALSYCGTSMLRDPRDNPLPAGIHVPVDIKYLHENDRILYQHMLQELNETEEYIWQYKSIGQYYQKISEEYYQSFAVILEGCRALIYTQIGARDYAFRSCRNAIDIINTIISFDITYFYLILGLSYAVQVCKTYDFKELYQEGLKVLESYQHLYPIMQKILHIIKSTEVSPNANNQPTATNSNEMHIFSYGQNQYMFSEDSFNPAMYANMAYAGDQMAYPDVVMHHSGMRNTLVLDRM